MLSQVRSAQAPPPDAFRFLSDASSELSSSLDYQATLQRIAHLAVPSIADWCAIDMVNDEGKARRVAVEHSDTARDEAAKALDKLWPVDTEAETGIAKVLRTGNPEFCPELSDELLQQTPLDLEHVELLRGLRLRSVMIVPFQAHGRTLGALTLICVGSRNPYAQADLQLAEDLARRAALALENARLYGQILDANRRKDEFLAMLGHELRNPLAPVLSAIEVLRLRGEDAESRQWVIGILDRQTRALSRLIEDLVDVSRITRGHIQLRKEPLVLAEVIERAVQSCRSAIDAKRHQLTVTLPEQPIFLEADAIRLEQILVNLLDNAAKYTEPGGRIWLGAERQKEEVVLRVRDSGEGLSQEMLPHIFDLFAQGSRPLDRSPGGLGIGLTLVRHLVAMHGGSVHASSGGQNCGSEFILRLPALETSPIAQDEPGPTIVDRNTPLRILVADDNVDSADGMAEVLGLWGYNVKVAYDGPGAVEAALDFRPDVVLLDIGLPGLDGYEVARTFRRNATLAGLFLVALTGYGQQEDQRRSHEAGFDLHFTKPVDLNALKKLLAARAGTG